MTTNEKIEKKTVEVQAPKKVKYQCLHTAEEKNVLASKQGLVLKKKL